MRKDETIRLATLKHGPFKLLCDLREDLQRQVYFFGTYFLEEHNLSCWEKESRGARVIFDVGANIGIYSFAALAAEPSATVHAFEPTPEIAVQLKKAAELNGLSQLKVHQTAVSSGNGFAKLNRCRGDNGTNGGMNFVFGDAGEDDPDRVSTVSLDTFCTENSTNCIDLLKVDVQGHEYEVFVGAEGLLMTGRRANNPRDPSSARESIRLLERYGYEFAAIAEELKWRQAGDWLHDLSDVLARKISRSRSSCPE
jgi:FkbM family methyltransferase